MQLTVVIDTFWNVTNIFLLKGPLRKSISIHITNKVLKYHVHFKPTSGKKTLIEMDLSLFCVDPDNTSFLVILMAL